MMMMNLKILKNSIKEQRANIDTVLEKIKNADKCDINSGLPFPKRFEECWYPAYYAISLEELELFDKIIDKYCLNEQEKKTLFTKIFDYDRQKAEGIITYMGYMHVLEILPEIKNELKPVGHAIALGRRMEAVIEEEKNHVKVAIMGMVRNH